MVILDTLLAALPEYPVIEIRVGLHWTAGVVQTPAGPRCGLAATMSTEASHLFLWEIAQAGRLDEISSKELAAYVNADQPLLTSIGMAILNACLPTPPNSMGGENAEEVIARRGLGRKVAMVGHFPFVDRLRQRLGKIDVLEINPQPGDIPADLADQVLPRADVIAITGMTLLNHTLERLLELCNPEAFKLILGPSTPLDERMFQFGIDWLSGCEVQDIPTVVHAVGQGANFRQLHSSGVRLVNLAAPEKRGI